MKKIFSQIVAAATILGLQAPYVAMAAADCPAGGKEIRLDIETVQQYLDYMDLDAAYLSDMESGGPGFFIALPNMVIADPSGATPPKPPQDMFGYYFKGSTGLATGLSGAGDFDDGDFEEEGDSEDSEGGYSGKPLLSEYARHLFLPYNPNAKASIGQTGFPGYPCSRDDNMNIAKIDADAFNKPATEDELKKLGIVYHPSYPAALKTAPGLPLTGGDMSIALGKKVDDKYVAANATEKGILGKAAVAKLHLKRLITGMRIVPGKDSGIVVDCAPTQSDTAESGYFGGTLLPVIIFADSYKGSLVDVQAIWYTGTVKEVGGKKIVVDASGKPMKADAINFYGDSFGGDFIWWKQPDGKTPNANKVIQLYRDMGYKYDAATSSDLSCQPKIRLTQSCGLITKNAKDDILISQEYGAITIINKKNITAYAGNKSEISDTDYAALAGAKCGCVDQATSYYYNYDDPENVIDLSFAMIAKNVTTSDLKTCTADKKIFKTYCGRVTKDEKGRLYIHDEPYNDLRFIPETSKPAAGVFTTPIDTAIGTKIFALKEKDCACITGARMTFSNGDDEYFDYILHASDFKKKTDKDCKASGV